MSQILTVGVWLQSRDNSMMKLQTIVNSRRLDKSNIDFSGGVLGQIRCESNLQLAAFNENDFLMLFIESDPVLESQNCRPTCTDRHTGRSFDTIDGHNS